MSKKHVIIFFAAVFSASNIFGWIYPEHRSISLFAIQKLNREQRAALDKIWAEARVGYEYRLTESVADYEQGLKPEFIDYAAWAAIGGDHSVSPENMLYNILETKWIMEVANVAARLKAGIAEAKNKSEIENELRNSDLRFLHADPEYVTRAGSNYGHFLLARPDENINADLYFDFCYREGADLNLIGNYVYYHSSALKKASLLANPGLTSKQRSAIALAALADEAFSHHFLEDGFSAGHVAGIWGNASQRKGTHDYYDEHGLDVITWNGKRMVLMGDAYMRPEDLEIASDIVLLSLVQFLDAAGGQIMTYTLNEANAVALPDTFNTAKAMVVPHYSITQPVEVLCDSILLNLPVPGLASGLGEIPRFRSEIGPFIGFSPAATLSGIFGGFGQEQTKNGFIPGLEVAVHIGLGTDGVLNKSGDGLVFLDLGWRLDGASTVKIYPGQEYKEFGSILSAIPSREAFYARIRIPFYLVPGDLILVGPFIYLFSPDAFNKMVTTASQGGLIPWQTGIITSLGRFQFMLGREVGVYLYGTIHKQDRLFVPYKSENYIGEALISTRTVKLDFPFFEYRPVRTYSSKQSASFFAQMFTAVDIPGKVIMIEPGNEPPVSLKPIWSVGVRLGFDWRYYY